MNEITVKEVKQNIKEKFGTISKFIKLANLDGSKLRAFFTAASYKMDQTRQNRLNNINKLVELTPVGDVDGEITDALRYKIWEECEKRGGVLKTSRDIDYSQDSIFQILNGTRSRLTDKVKELLTKLDIEQ